MQRYSVSASQRASTDISAVAHSLMSVHARVQSVASEGSGDIFASYKQNDGSDALLMNMYHTLKPLEVWLDKMRGEERSEAGMVAGVKTCRLFCAVISPAYFQSAFCLLEIRTALQQKKKIAVCYNGSKYKVQEALAWIPTEFARLRDEEVIMLHEDNEFMEVGLRKLKQRLKQRRRISERWQGSKRRS